MKQNAFFRSVLLCLLTPFSSEAQEVKKNDTTHSTLNLTSNWVDGIVPGVNDVALWDAPYNRTPSIAASLGDDLAWKGIRVVSPTSVPRIRNTSGKTLTLGSTGIDMSGATQNFEVYASTALGANQAWTVAAGRTLTVSAALSGSGVTLTKAGSGILNLIAATSLSMNIALQEGTLTVGHASGTIELTGALSGSGALSKSAAGVLTLSNDNTSYTGALALGAGTLNLHHAAALGSSTLSISAGSLGNASGAAVTLTGSAAQTWGSTVTFVGPDALHLGNTAVTITANTDVAVSGTAVASVAGTVTASAGVLTKSGTGTLQVNAGAAVEISGKIAVNGGVLQVNGGTLRCGNTAAAALEISGGIVELLGGATDVRAVSRPSGTGTLRFKGGTLRPRGDSATFISGLTAAEVGAGGAKIELDGWLATIPQPLVHDPSLGSTADDGLRVTDILGNGRLTLTAASTYTGPTIIESGTLRLGTGGSIASSPVIEVQEAGTFDGQTGTTVASGQTVRGTGTLLGKVTIGAGSTLSPGVAGVGAMKGDMLILQGNTLMEVTKTGGVINNDRVFNLWQLTYGGSLTVTKSGDALAAGDRLVLFESASYGGTFSSLSLPVLPTGLFWETAGLAVDGSIEVVSTLPQPVLDPAGPSCFSSESIVITGFSGSMIHYTIDGSDPKTSPTVISGLSPLSGIVVPSGTTAFTLNVYASLPGGGESIVVSQDFVIVDTATWTKTDSGTWSDASNWLAYLPAQGAGKTADFSTLSLALNPIVTLDSSRVIGNLKFGVTSGLFDWAVQPTASATLTLSATSQPQIEVVNRSVILATPLAGSQGFAKTGVGTLTLASDNTLTGTITVAAGLLRVGNGSVAGTLGAAAIVNNSTLIFQRSDSYTIPNDISGTGKIFVEVGNTLTLSGALTCPVLRINGAGNRTVTLAGSTANAINLLEDAQDGSCTLVFAKPPGVNAFAGPVLDVGSGYASQFAVRLSNSEQIPDTTVVKMFGWDNYYGGRSWFQLNGFHETIAGLNEGTSTSYVQNGAATPSVLTLSGSGTYSLRGSVHNGSTGTLSIVMNGTGTQTFTGNAIDYTGTTIVNSGRLIFSANDDCWTTRIEIAAGATVEVARDNTDIFENQSNCTVTGAGTYLKTGNGTMDMNWSNRGTVAMTSGGHIWVKEGTLRLGYGSYSDWTNNKADLTVSSGAIFDLWDNNTTTVGVIVDALQGGGQIVRSTYGNTGNLTVGVDGGSGDFTGSISNASGIIHFIKNGTGTQKLSGANSYTGTTTINGGALVVHGSLDAGSAVTVSALGTLGGTGSVSGNVTAMGAIAPGDGGVGTLTTGPVVLTGTYQCQISGATSDRLVVKGNLNLTGSTLLISAVSPPTPGTYVIATYTDTLTGTLGGTLPTGYALDYSTANQIKLIVPAGSDPFSSWASANGITGGKNGDDDGDGVKNLLEFATNSNASATTGGAASGPRCYPLIHQIGADRVLTYTIATRKSASFSASGSKQVATIDQIRYTVEASSDLSVWNVIGVSEVTGQTATDIRSALGAAITNPELDAEWEWHTFRVSPSIQTQPRCLIRLHVEEVAP
jgi:autotransporter-associated beta strand protein